MAVTKYHAIKHTKSMELKLEAFLTTALDGGERQELVLQLPLFMGKEIHGL
jgi:hypothetical protein